MLAVSPFRREGEIENTFPMGGIGDEFPDFCGDNLLESIDFDELFVGIEIDGAVLPDLEVDGGDFSVSGGEDSSEMNTFTSVSFEKTHEEDNKVSGSGSAGSSLIQEEEIVSKRENESDAVVINSSRKGGHEKRKKSKNHHGKRKVKVDWTPELHKRFVQAVEQLGVDKAVPSRILELMGIDCLTRHNIASHLQKYRSHRKHLIAREAEAASWSHRRQMYGGGSGGGGMKREMMSNNSPWLGVAPTMGFPPMAPPPPIMPHHFRPLHVWGHPHVDRSLGHVWPKQISPSPPPPPPPHFAHPPPPPGSSFWHAYHQRVPNSFTPGTPYFPPPSQLTPSRFPNPPVQGIPTHAMYKVDAGSGAPLTNSPTSPPLVDFHPSKESIDAAIGDVLSEPWQPLPLGLNPPSLDSVMVELNLQGIPKIPPC